MADDDNGGEQFGGFAFPMPPGFGRAIAEAHSNHERAHMEVDLLQQRIYNYLDHCDVDTLLLLRRMFNADRESNWNNYFDGQIVSILRVVHHVDPDTGKSIHDEIAGT